jgi:hypothetical protein
VIHLPFCFSTIGYGNTAPLTPEGKRLVVSLGFFSILAFTSCIGSAAFVTLCIVEDFFKRIKMLRRMTEGALSAFFWYFSLIIWIVIVAAISDAYVRAFLRLDMTFRDHMWFSYISITTVGFGDRYVNHEGFLHENMLYIPVLLLIGFVFLANCLVKLSRIKFFEIIAEKLGFSDHDMSLDVILARNRRMRREKKDVGNEVIEIGNPRDAENPDDDDDDIVFDDIKPKGGQQKRSDSNYAAVDDDDISYE